MFFNLENINLEECVELQLEITEALEHNLEEFFVHRIIRHNYLLRDKSSQVESTIVTAALPLLPLAKSYAGASLLAELMVEVNFCEWLVYVLENRHAYDNDYSNTELLPHN